MLNYCRSCFEASGVKRKATVAVKYDNDEDEDEEEEGLASKKGNMFYMIFSFISIYSVFCHIFDVA